VLDNDNKKTIFLIKFILIFFFCSEYINNLMSKFKSLSFLSISIFDGKHFTIFTTLRPVASFKQNDLILS
jgi:hypothetical protein